VHLHRSPQPRPGNAAVPRCIIVNDARCATYPKAYVLLLGRRAHVVAALLDARQLPASESQLGDADLSLSYNKPENLDYREVVGRPRFCRPGLQRPAHIAERAALRGRCAAARSCAHLRQRSLAFSVFGHHGWLVQRHGHPMGTADDGDSPCDGGCRRRRLSNGRRHWDRLPCRGAELLDVAGDLRDCVGELPPC
jgi:hypothetical protein